MNSTVSYKLSVLIPNRPKVFVRPYFHCCSSGVHYCVDRFNIHEALSLGKKGNFLSRHLRVHCQIKINLRMSMTVRSKTIKSEKNSSNMSCKNITNTKDKFIIL